MRPVGHLFEGIWLTIGVAKGHRQVDHEVLAGREGTLNGWRPFIEYLNLAAVRIAALKLLANRERNPHHVDRRVGGCALYALGIGGNNQEFIDSLVGR